MVEPVLLISTYGILGAGIKYIDQAYDSKLFNKRIAILLAVLMGILMGTAAALDPTSAMIFLSFIIFALISKKIDNPAFYIGTILVFLVPITRSMFNQESYYINWLLLTGLIFSGLIDEEGNSRADSGKIRGVVGAFFKYRCFMKISVFLMAMAGLMPLIYFIAFLAYDLSYLCVEVCTSKMIQKGYLISRYK